MNFTLQTRLSFVSRIFLGSLFFGKTVSPMNLPIVIPEDISFEEYSETSAFKKVIKIITALSSQDKRISEELKLIEQGKRSKGKVIEINSNHTNANYNLGLVFYKLKQLGKAKNFLEIKRSVCLSSHAFTCVIIEVSCIIN